MVSVPGRLSAVSAGVVSKTGHAHPTCCCAGSVKEISMSPSMVPWGKVSVARPEGEVTVPPLEPMVAADGLGMRWTSWVVVAAAVTRTSAA